ncbi:MAG: NifU family protein [Actinobacteria bacterium]|nr:NifU family protein [Actinomycetota bacterium]
MDDLSVLLERLEVLLGEIEQLDETSRLNVFELLDGIDTLHRIALNRLAAGVDPSLLQKLRKDPFVSWLLDAYAAGVDERAAADHALNEIRPYIHSHGGMAEVLDASGGIVKLHLSGACAGCSASAITLKEGIERALRDNFPGFVALEVEEQDAPSHPPPGPTLLQIQPPPTS